MMEMYTFNPPGHELIQRYLNNKITGKATPEDERHIPQVNMCHIEPTEIPGLTNMKSTHTWHLISRVEKLKGKCKRTNRASKKKKGHWKLTGKDIDVKDLRGNTIGFKKYLVYDDKEDQSCSSSSMATQNNKSIYKWTMHEFHSSIQHPNKDDFVVCKVMKRVRIPRSKAVIETPSAATDLLPLLSPSPDYFINPPEPETQNDIISGNVFVGEDYECSYMYDPYMQNLDLADFETGFL